jgi:hypothetical protein
MVKTNLAEFVDYNSSIGQARLPQQTRDKRRFAAT